MKRAVEEAAGDEHILIPGRGSDWQTSALILHNYSETGELLPIMSLGGIETVYN